jgi:hypothetical protein
MDEFDYFGSSRDPLIVWLLRPHNEHTIAFTKLWFASLLPIVGLRHYALYALPLVLAHLVVVGVVYRLTWLSTGYRTVAAAAALMTAAMGAALGTLTWAGQFQYVGAVAPGLMIILLASETRTRRHVTAVFVATVIGTFSGTAFVAFALAGAVAYAYRRRWHEAVVVAALPVSWQLLMRALWAPADPYAAHGLGEIMRLGPAFAFSILDNGISQTVGDPHLSAALLVALAVGTLALLSGARGSRTSDVARDVTGTLALATLLSMSVLVAGRLELGPSLANGGGYSYLFLATLFPLAGILLGQVARRRSARVAIVGTMAVISVIGVATISYGARSLSDWKLSGERVMQAAAAELARGLSTYPDQVPAPDTAPTVSQETLLSWVASRSLDPVNTDSTASDQASLNMQWRLVAGTDVPSHCQLLASGEQASIPAAAGTLLTAMQAGTAVTVQYLASPARRRFELPSSTSALQSVANRGALLSVDAGSARACLAP